MTYTNNYKIDRHIRSIHKGVRKFRRKKATSGAGTEEAVSSMASLNKNASMLEPRRSTIHESRPCSGAIAAIVAEIGLSTHKLALQLDYPVIEKQSGNK